ncbi:MAG: hypothetical protein FWG91_11000 [Lachnospiraceae bacterium]|nr:hypothetical protein [Lachnospiraceae bacterium]
MLGKLIKHEFKAVGKFLTIVASFMVCLTLVGAIGIYVFTPHLYFYLNGITIDGTQNLSFFAEIMTSLYVLAYFASAFLLTAGTYIYLWIRFHNSMYGHQGYLTNTLPTTPAKLIMAKMITAVTWVSASILLLIGSIMVLATATANASGAKTNNNLPELAALLRESRISVPWTIVLYFSLAVAAIIFSVMMMYGSSALGQLAKKNRVFATLGFYFAMTMVINVVGTFALAVNALIINRDKFGEYFYIFRGINLIGFTFLVLAVVGAVLLYFLTYYVTSKRLNLE